MKVAFQCVRVLFLACLRWECLPEGVVGLGVTGIFSSLLRDHRFCVRNAA